MPVGFYLIALAALAVLAGPAIAERMLLKRRPDLVTRLGLRVGKIRRIALPPEAERVLRPPQAGAYRFAEVGEPDPTALVDANVITLLQHEVDGVVHVFPERKLVAVVPRTVSRKNDTSWAWFAELRIEDHALVLVPRFFPGGVLTKLASATLAGLATWHLDVALMVLAPSLVFLAMQLAFTAYRLQGIVAVTETLLTGAVAQIASGARVSAPAIRVADDASIEEEEPPAEEPARRERAG